MSEKIKILIVEDDKNTLEILNEAMVNAGYLTECAENAEQAFSLLKGWKPRLVITDHDMPGSTGLEFLKELRAQKIYVTLIFVSGRKDTDTVVEALRSGADDYIYKPFRLEELLARVEVCLRNNDAHRELFEANDKLQEMVDTDYLTGLYNMRSIYEKIDFELHRSRRNIQKVSCVMLDMDHFKSVNDDNDHLFGSFVLKEVGKIIQDNVREIDFAARYGGDEFLVVLTEVDKKDVEQFSERIRSVIESYDFKDGDNQIKLTVSIGYSLSSKNFEGDSRDLVRHADNALYIAKDKGRNTIAEKIL